MVLRLSQRPFSNAVNSNGDYALHTLPNIDAWDSVKTKNS